MLEAAGANSHSTEMATKILIHVHPEFSSFFRQWGGGRFPEICPLEEQHVVIGGTHMGQHVVGVPVVVSIMS